VSFPIAATTVTDDFQRANEIPIGAPWDVSAFAGSEADLISNHFAARDRTTYWEGEAYYAGLWGNVETAVEIDALTGVGGGYCRVFLNNTTTDDGAYIDMLSTGLVTFTASDFNAVVVYEVTDSGVATSGDMIGMRIYGGIASGWVKRVASASWTKVGETSIPPISARLRLSCYGDTGPVTVSEFRIAEVGEIITPRPRIRSRRTSW
jgi:hypothetical protein